MNNLTKYILFFLLLVANIFCVEVGWMSGVNLTKPILIPVLAWQLMGTEWGRVRWVWFALFFSWIGDVLLMLPYDLFIFGLGSFLIAHLFYIRHFLQQWNRKQEQFQAAYLFGVLSYLGILLYLLFPVLGALKVPVIFYGIIISTMLLLALQTRKRGYQLGALCFVLSDSLLAINKFHTPLPLAGLWVMSTYGLAQFYIVKTSRI